MTKTKSLHKSVKIFDTGYRGECPYEEIEQINAVSWFRHNYPQYNCLFFHPVNEGKIPVQYRSKLNKMGMRSGIPDIVLLVSTNNHPYAVFEMKRTGGGRLSASQKDCLNAASDQGAFACVCFGFEMFKMAVDEYFGPGYNSA